MAAGDNKVYKKVTLPASGPGQFASVELTTTGIAGTDMPVVSIFGTTRPVTGTGDSFGVYVESIATKSLVIKANKMQTPAVSVIAVVVEV